MTTYTYTTLDPLGLGSSPIGINAAGDVIGTFYNGTTTDGFVEINGTINDLGQLGTNILVGGVNTPLFINASGQVAGVDANGNAFLWGGMTTTIAPSSQVVGIDAAGDVAYWAGNQDFLYSNGTVITIYTSPRAGTGEFGINDAGQVIFIEYPFGFIYSGGSLTGIGGVSSQSSSIRLGKSLAYLNLASQAPLIDMPSSTVPRQEASISVPPATIS
jgi:probable HAF family extracellular repeat protein